ncbi:MAG: AMP-binding protein [Gammaproteobacteria bacterium]|nr:AMP-binding protein [Gammaproteobacteria bacterium]
MTRPHGLYDRGIASGRGDFPWRCWRGEHPGWLRAAGGAAHGLRIRDPGFRFRTCRGACASASICQPRRDHRLREQEVSDELVCAAQESECFPLHLDQDGLRAASAGVPAGAASTADDAAHHPVHPGTTGVPKCVSVSHRPLVHFCTGRPSAFELDRNDRVTVLSGLGHDLRCGIFFSRSRSGRDVVVAGSAGDRDAKALFDWMAASRPTVCHLTPQIGHLILGGMRKANAADVALSVQSADPCCGSRGPVSCS